MSKPQQHKLWSALLALCLISGCADHVSGHSGTQLDVVPVTYSIGIKIKDGEQAKANEKLTGFTTKYWKIIVNQGATISWQSNAGKVMAQQYYTQLASRGVNVSDLILDQTQGTQNNDAEQQNVKPEYFDVEVKTTVHRIIGDVCQYPKVGHYDELSDGCSSESNRWKSMVHPENMLDHTPKNTL
jgi:hypothetical protein